MKYLSLILVFACQVNAHTISKAHLDYAADLAFRRFNPEYVNPMKEIHDTNNRISVDSKGTVTSEHRARFAKAAERLDDRLKNEYWPMQEVILTRLEMALGQKVTVGERTDFLLDLIQIEDKDLEELIWDSFNHLEDDLHLAASKEFHRSKLKGPADYAEGWRKARELWKPNPICDAILRRGA